MKQAYKDVYDMSLVMEDSILPTTEKIEWIFKCF